MDTFPWGKFKGKTLKEVPTAYLRNVLKFLYGSDLKDVQAEIERRKRRSIWIEQQHDRHLRSIQNE